MLIRGSPNGARHPIHTPAAIGRNQWPSSTGMGGRHQSEPLAAIARYAQLGLHVSPASVQDRDMIAPLLSVVARLRWNGWIEPGNRIG